MMRSSQRRRINMMNNELMQISRIKIDQNKYRFCVEENMRSESAINIVDINMSTRKISCSCDDAKSYSNMHMQIICKHGCFILIKVLELFEENSSFFINMTFTNNDIAMIPNKILNLHPSLITDEYNNIDHLFNVYDNDNSESDTDYSDSDISSLQQSIITPFVRRYALSSNESEKNSYTKSNSQLKKKILIKKENKIFLKEDVCPVCFEQLNNTDVIKCSNCNNYVHTECLESWLLKNNSSCILCRENIKNDILHTKNLKYNCDCGSIIDSSYIKKHQLTKKHLNFISPNQ